MNFWREKKKPLTLLNILRARRIEASVGESLDQEFLDVRLPELVQGPLHHATDQAIGDGVLRRVGHPPRSHDLHPLLLERLEEEEIEGLQHVGAVRGNDDRDDVVLLADDPDFVRHVGSEKNQ